jgi:hypothetical protein
VQLLQLAAVELRKVLAQELQADQVVADQVGLLAVQHPLLDKVTQVAQAAVQVMAAAVVAQAA